MAGEVEARLAALNITLPDAPAPSSKPLEEAYYPSVNEICSSVIEQMS